jgi:predicted 3-demethylubiquinone-9 3-methyltransferase (glyoxalase superfamily)
MKAYVQDKAEFDNGLKIYIQNSLSRRKDMSQKFTTCLWFENQAEPAANFYVSIFKNAKILSVLLYGEESAEASGMPQGSVMTVSFQLDGQEFLALNGGPVYKISPAISFIVNCETQAEVDAMWERLSAGGEEVQCGWLTDKFGVSWQVVPIQLEQLLGDPDLAKAGRVMQALLQMKKLDIAGLQRAYEAT